MMKNKKLQLNKKTISRLQLGQIKGGSPTVEDTITTFRVLCTNHPKQKSDYGDCDIDINTPTTPQSSDVNC